MKLPSSRTRSPDRGPVGSAADMGLDCREPGDARFRAATGGVQGRVGPSRPGTVEFDRGESAVPSAENGFGFGVTGHRRGSGASTRGGQSGGTPPTASAGLRPRPSTRPRPRRSGATTAPGGKGRGGGDHRHRHVRPSLRRPGPGRRTGNGHRFTGRLVDRLRPGARRPGARRSGVRPLPEPRADSSIRPSASWPSAGPAGRRGASSSSPSTASPCVPWGWTRRSSMPCPTGRPPPATPRCSAWCWPTPTVSSSIGVGYPTGLFDALRGHLG